MRNNTHASYQRRVNRHLSKMLVAAFFLVVGGGVIVTLRQILAPAPFRQSIFIAGKPGYIISFAPTRKSVTLLDVPPDVVIKGLYGYGRYSIGSLTSLDAIDKHEGRLVRESVADAVGVPLFWTVMPDDAFASVGDPIEDMRRIFTWPSIIEAFMGRMETDIPALTWMALVVSIRSLPSDAFLYVQSNATLSEIESADGSTQKLLDESKLDYVLSQSFFDNGLRGEGLTVSLYNTTTVPTVGLRTSRLLTRIGIQLVFVGNSDGNLKECVVTGDKSALESNTAAFIRAYFHCTNRPPGSSDVGSGTGADLVVELGTDVAAKYR